MWKIQGGIVYINDPASTRAVRIRGDYDLFKTQVKYYWVIEKPVSNLDTDKEEDDMTKEDVIKIMEEQKTVYDTIAQVPDWGKATVQKLMNTPTKLNPEKTILEGEGDGLGLTYDLLRALVILDRAGLYD